MTTNQGDASRPRVQITYETEVDGRREEVELPFVLGVLADLSGQPAQAPRPLRERKFVAVDRDRFDDVLARHAPRLALAVPDRLTDGGGEVRVELEFRALADFEPARVAAQVAPLRDLLAVRKDLAGLLDDLRDFPELGPLLAELIHDPRLAAEVARELGATP